MSHLCLFIVEPVLDLPLVLYNSPRILCLGHRRLSRNGDDLLGIVIALEFCYASRDGGLLARGEFIFAAKAARLGCGALFVLGVDGDFGRVVAGIDDICPAGRDRSRGIGEHFDVRHVGG